MNLVCIPFHDWNKSEREGFRTRDVHLLEEFGKHPLVEKILVVNRPLFPLEMLQKQVFRRDKTVRQVAEKIYTVDSVLFHIWQPLILRRDWIPKAYGHVQTVRTVQSAIRYLDIKLYTIWSNSPIHVPLIKQLDPQCYIFDMTDNLTKHAHYRNLKYLQDFYEYAQKYADFLTANSPDNTNWLAKKRPDTAYIPNGVSLERFDSQLQLTKPADISAIKPPIVGFAGKMQEMIDLDLMENVAKAFPQISFVFIGQLLNPKWMQHLWRFPNVYYLGDKHYDLLPNYLASFDICIIPYSTQRQHGGDPIKFYEYLAMGKPIVTTDIGGVSRFREFLQVCVAESSPEFIQGIETFAQMIVKGERLLPRDVPSDITWSYKANQILQMIATKM